MNEWLVTFALGIVFFLAVVGSAFLAFTIGAAPAYLLGANWWPWAGIASEVLALIGVGAALDS